MQYNKDDGLHDGLQPILEQHQMSVVEMQGETQVSSGGNQIKAS